MAGRTQPAAARPLSSQHAASLIHPFVRFHQRYNKAPGSTGNTGNPRNIRNAGLKMKVAAESSRANGNTARFHRREKLIQSSRRAQGRPGLLRLIGILGSFLESSQSQFHQYFPPACLSSWEVAALHVSLHRQHIWILGTSGRSVHEPDRRGITSLVIPSLIYLLTR